MAWISTALIGLLAMIIIPACVPSSPTVDPSALKKMIKEDSAVVIDVRTPAEINEGYISGTRHFFSINDQHFNDSISSLNPNQTYVVYCKSGARSAKAAKAMKDKGFQKVYSLKGGIDAWIKEQQHP